MSIHNISFRGEIRKKINTFHEKVLYLELCRYCNYPKYIEFISLF